MRSSKTANAPLVPLPVSLTRAIDASERLAGLAARLAESEQRLAAIAPLVPEPMRRELRPGPVDDEGWSVLVSNAAVAAKLRHLLPRFVEALRARAFRDVPIRVRVRSH
jgi:hypothetical protein